MRSLDTPLILMLHRVMPDYDAENYYFQRQTAISTSKFNQLLASIKSNGWKTASASQLSEHKPGSRVVYITFDDGYADNIEPIEKLNREGMVATIFPVKDFVIERFSPIDDLAKHINLNSIDNIPIKLRKSLLGGRYKKVLRRLSSMRYRDLRFKLFNIGHDQCPLDLFLNELQLRQLAFSGNELGLHGCSHRVFDSLPKSKLTKELEDNRNWLNSLTGQRTYSVCFPHGRHNQEVIEQCQFATSLLGVDTPAQHYSVYRRVHFTERTNINELFS